MRPPAISFILFTVLHERQNRRFGESAQAYSTFITTGRQGSALVFRQSWHVSAPKTQRLAPVLHRLCLKASTYAHVSSAMASRCAALKPNVLVDSTTVRSVPSCAYKL